MAWIKEVEAENIEGDGVYFIALRRVTRLAPYMFWSEYLSGKTGWSQKPGIACQYDGSVIKERMIKEKEKCVAVLVPPDAAKRWKARKTKVRR